MSLPALISGGASIIGGLLGKKSSSSQNKVAREMYYQDREWYDKDRTNERRYARSQRDNDRSYAQKQRDDERKYAKSVLVDQRVYDSKVRADQRKYDRNQLASDRKYADGQLKDQRNYDGKMYERDINRFDTDRDKMQKRSNSLAERTAASRGIDFVKMRDDAVKAGYNPMTALSMAHAYSTQVDYSLQGGVYSPGANYTTGNAAYSPMGSAGSGAGSGGAAAMAAPGAVMPSQVPAGGSFQSNGAGYASSFQPSLSAGSFIADAVARGVDSWANRPIERDPLADALRNAFQQDQMAEQVRDAQLPDRRGFGYDLTKQRAFQPAATVGVPALASANAAPGPAKMPSGIIEKGGRKYVPVTLPDGSQSSLQASVARRYDIEPFDTLSAGDWEEIRGGVVGELENTINADQNYDLMTGGNFWPVPPSAGDYAKSGRTGQQMFQSWPSN